MFFSSSNTLKIVMSDLLLYLYVIERIQVCRLIKICGACQLVSRQNLQVRFNDIRLCEMHDRFKILTAV